MNKKLKALALGGVVVASALAGAGLHYVMAEPKEVEVTKVVYQNVSVPVEVVKEVKVEVPKEVKVEVPVEDESFKALACDRLLFDDVKECVVEVKAEDAALKLAIAKIQDDFAEELESADIVAKEKYAELVKVYTSYDDLKVEDSDFDNEEYTFVIKAKINDNHEEAKSYVNFTVDVKDGEAEIVDVESI